MLAFGKAEAEEQVKLVQEKLSKGMTQEVVAAVSAIEIDKAKLRIPKKKCKFCNRTGHRSSPDKKTRKIVQGFW